MRLRGIALTALVGITVVLVMSWLVHPAVESPAARKTPPTGQVGGKLPNRPVGPALPAEAAKKLTLAEILKETNPVRMTAIAAERFLALAPGEFATDLNALLAQPPSLRRQELLRYLLHQWGRVDPQGVWPFVAALPNLLVTDRVKYTNWALEGWVTQHPAEAWAWAVQSLANLPDKYATGGAVASMSVAEQRAGASQDNRMKSPVAALLEVGQYKTVAELVGRGPEDSAEHPGSGYVGALIRAWYAADPEAALGWVGSLSPSSKEAPSSRVPALSSLVSEMALVDSGTAAHYVAALQDFQDISSAALGLMTGFSILGDRAGAYSWLRENVGENQAQLTHNGFGPFDSAIQLLFDPSKFSGADILDPIGELQLVGKIRSATNREQAVQGYMARTLERDPMKAVEAVLAYSSENRRVNNLTVIVTRVAKRDPAAALGLVEGMSGVTEDVRSRLRIAATTSSP